MSSNEDKKTPTAAVKRDLRAIKSLLELFDHYQLDSLEVGDIKIHRQYRPKPIVPVSQVTPEKKHKTIEQALNVKDELEAFWAPEKSN